MHLYRLIATAAFLLAGMLVLPRPAHAAQSLDTCAGYIDTLPSTISTQGVWCLRHDLSTNITNGAAITIATNNLTIDCNDFKLGGLAGGDASTAKGIYADSTRQNATIRHCNIRGFRSGIGLDGAGHLVEDNRLDNNLEYGMYVLGDNIRVRRNAVYDTGGATGLGSAVGIYASGVITDNIVSGLSADKAGTGYLFGIRLWSQASQVSRNVVTGFNMTATGPAGGSLGGAIGIDSFSLAVAITGNTVLFNDAGLGTKGINGYSAGNECMDNVVQGFTTAFFQCTVTNHGGADTNVY